MRVLDQHKERAGKDESASCLTLYWDYEVCTSGMESAFARLARCIERSGRRKFILDMSKCNYLSISGLRAIMDWYFSMAADGCEIRVTGLSSLQAKIFFLSRLEWILLDSVSGNSRF